ncbi:Mov34/MPN/PAD-1 family protein [Brevibacillus borstelensis]|uniref:Mov34/MPN/PAD-1 family protein n=1 Tax=Brevibacillus borstelensis TaxID=45462 RepID=UPI0030C0FF42
MIPGLLGEPFGFKHTKTCLDRKVAKRLLAQAKETFPLEYSALLAGQDARITSHIPMASARPSTDAFSWDSAAFFQALQLIKQRELQWLGVLHSHPATPPVPSATDQRGWHYPQLGYWILGLAGDEPELRLYQWENGGFGERSFLYVDSSLP